MLKRVTLTVVLLLLILLATIEPKPAIWIMARLHVEKKCARFLASLRDQNYKKPEATSLTRFTPIDLQA
jgi:hypothetical protein